MKKVLSIILTAVVLFSLCACNKGKNSNVYERNKNYIYFGYYPKSLKSNNVTVSYDPNSDGYYTGSDGELYVKQTAKLNDSEGYTFEDGSNMVNGKTYYFKLEKIKWNVISEQNGVALLLCENIINSMAFTQTNSTSYNNNYKQSSVRNWLNTDFYKNAFSAEEKNIIKKTLVNNAPETTVSTASAYCCEDTNDNVFLLSYSDVKNTNYGFLTTEDDDPKRIKFATDYAIACGTEIKFSRYSTAGYWLLRSPGNINYNAVRGVYYDGDCDGNYNATNTNAGIVPAIQIYL